MATTMNISLSEELRDFIDQQVREGGFVSSSEYMRAVLRKERELAQFRQLLIDGRESGSAEAVGDAWFDALREDVRKQAAATE